MHSTSGVENNGTGETVTSGEPIVADEVDGRDPTGSGAGGPESTDPGASGPEPTDPGTDGSETDGPRRLSQADAFDVLSNRRRRYVIHALKHADEPLDVSELSTRVTAWELDVDPETVEYEDRRNVHSTLRRTHLPKLEEKDVISVDDDTDLVRETPVLEDLDVYVEVLHGKEIPWSHYYVGLAGLSAVLLLAVAVGAPGVAALSPLSVAVFTATAFGISSLTHYVLGRRMRLGNAEKPPELRRGG